MKYTHVLGVAFLLPQLLFLRQAQASEVNAQITPRDTASAAVTFLARQQPGDWRTATMIGATVKSPDGQDLGEIYDLLIGADGRVTVAVIGVGGMLGIGEKHVGVPFQVLAITRRTDGGQVVTLDASSRTLAAAPEFENTEYTLSERLERKASEFGRKAKDTATDIGKRAADKAKEMQEQQGAPKN